MDHTAQWKRFQQYLCDVPEVGLRLDVSRMAFPDGFIAAMADRMNAALDAMQAIEAGAIANATEKRRVGHYWLRDADLAPAADLRDAIVDTHDRIRTFAAEVSDGRIKPQRGDGFYVLLVVGIGGSALGPQLLADALGSADDPLLVRFIDNTDPDGIQRVLAELDDELAHTLTLVISKSGGTPETRNAMLEVAAAYARARLDFPAHAVAVTADGSALARQARAQNWRAVFPMWDFVGGRTSITSAVGLLPAALLGFDIDALLAGARDADAATRRRPIENNPAALMALMWHYAGDGRGRRHLVILPYRDRLALLGKYLQQLVMESIGKAVDRAGRTVHQGLTVFGNKGSTDQHAYVQQLRDGLNNFFVTFIEVLRDEAPSRLEVEPGVTSSDYLSGFLHGTRAALSDAGRESMTITLNRLDAYTLGALIALFERAVGLYADLINVNAYDQPGVEAGKQAARHLLELQQRILQHLQARPGAAHAAEQLAAALDVEDVETVFHILEHLAADPGRALAASAAPDVGSRTFAIRPA